MVYQAKMTPAAGPFELAFLARRPWRGLTTALAQALVEAASVCLAAARHPETFSLLLVREGGSQTTLPCQRLAVTEQMQAAHDDLHEATERGASALAILLAHRELGYEVVRRSRKTSGFDYWLQKEAPASQPFEARLEVSGVLENPAAVRARAAQKRDQTRASDRPGFPVVIAVVEFGTPVALLEHYP